MALKVCLLEAVRRRTFICCRSIKISTSSSARDRIRSTTIQTMSLTRSLITQQHRPILDQLLVRLGLRQGQVKRTSLTSDEGLKPRAQAAPSKGETLLPSKCLFDQSSFRARRAF